MIETELDESYAIKAERQSSFPSSYTRFMEGDLTARELDVDKSVRQHAGAYTPLWRFTSPIAVIRSLKPVSVKVCKGEKLFFAENENLGIFTTGETRISAIKAFCEQLIHFYRHYTNLNWEQVTGDAHRLKQYYENFFQKVCE
ncbi:MAG: hypothetical protein D8M57_19260 [Candidatus Scalindua sp. AMX11]|nr:MAG: hypothetical protein DWQ00_14760 [Candidatus Scalindua sp.]NOG85238.1 hypothetical protein [Planctomycetota bacterium]RZV61712.1 MAG: hypothetical protein EX341_18785 [Candidatus Scalindua sp. SCAELEC01]TDE63251.1 MAG: hypothetical protein D8M57_19260 [Candidatus Scalindua sp. AMX11]